MLVGWLCLESDSFLKKCESRCWLHQLWWELEFIWNNKYISRVERHVICRRILKKYQKKFSNNFDYFLMTASSRH